MAKPPATKYGGQVELRKLRYLAPKMNRIAYHNKGERGGVT